MGKKLDISIVTSLCGAGLEREYLLLRELLMSQGHYVMGVHYTDMSCALHPSDIGALSFDFVERSVRVDFGSAAFAICPDDVKPPCDFQRPNVGGIGDARRVHFVAPCRVTSPCVGAKPAQRECQTRIVRPGPVRLCERHGQGFDPTGRLNALLRRSPVTGLRWRKARRFRQGQACGGRERDGAFGARSEGDGFGPLERRADRDVRQAHSMVPKSPAIDG